MAITGVTANRGGGKSITPTGVTLISKGWAPNPKHSDGTFATAVATFFRGINTLKTALNIAVGGYAKQFAQVAGYNLLANNGQAVYLRTGLTPEAVW